ncbi:type II CAAX prenyl endopeptidase Rce1 family protein [Nonomuraea antimicrobica]|uniref:CPBP family glutamic-type intramembrane protease n=1 Tax=Nonomuraea antimicrobica TaxID=561173 RepID=UPI0031EB624E
MTIHGPAVSTEQFFDQAHGVLSVDHRPILAVRSFLGINPILPVAFVGGVLAALLFRWSGSIWSGIALHGVNNATALLVPLLIALAGV